MTLEDVKKTLKTDVAFVTDQVAKPRACRKEHWPTHDTYLSCRKPYRNCHWEAHRGFNTGGFPFVTSCACVVCYEYQLGIMARWA